MLIPPVHTVITSWMEKWPQPKSIGVSLRTSDKIIGEGKPSFCWSYTTEKKKKKDTLKLPVVILPLCGKDSLKIKPKQKKAESRDWYGDWGGGWVGFLGRKPCLKPVLPLDFLVSWANECPFFLKPVWLEFLPFATESVLASKKRFIVIKWRNPLEELYIDRMCSEL